jgi:thioredoxin reductase (NADPH)
LRVKGFSEYIGKGISFCAICDGFLYRNRSIGLIGAGDFMHEEYEILKNFSKNITVFTNGSTQTVEPHGATIVTDAIKSIGGSDTVEYVETATAKHPVDVVFLAIGTPSATDFALRMGAFINNGELSVDANFMTNIPGLFAAGDCIGGLFQIAKAVSDGAHASLAINQYLRSKTS